MTVKDETLVISILLFVPVLSATPVAANQTDNVPHETVYKLPLNFGTVCQWGTIS